MTQMTNNQTNYPYDIRRNYRAWLTDIVQGAM